MLYQRAGISLSSRRMRVAVEDAVTLMFLPPFNVVPGCSTLEAMSEPDQSAMLEALRILVEAESPSTDKERCDRCADAVAELFRSVARADARRHARPAQGDHLELRFGSGGEPILILCHYDTVWDAGTLERLP